jgi:hypothetical protein
VAALSLSSPRDANRRQVTFKQGFISAGPSVLQFDFVVIIRYPKSKTLLCCV